MEKKRAIFICIHNSGRSQMGEGFLRHYGGDLFEVHSAGIEAGTLNPLVVKAMAESGIDISKHWAKKALDFVKAGEKFDYVITVCDETNAERCPIFPGINTRLHWGFPDPSSLGGTEEEKIAGIRPIRDAIEEKVKNWVSEIRKNIHN